MNRMRWISMFAPATLVVALGCGGQMAGQVTTPTGSNDVAAATSPGDPAQVGAGEVEDESTADLAEHHRHHSHGGFAMFIAMSLDSLGTSPEQQAQIEQLRDQLFAKLQPAHDAEKNVLNILADGVAAGQINDAQIHPAIEQLGAAAAGTHDAVADSLNQLHAILTPSQRQALVDKVEAHLAVWHHANDGDETTVDDTHGGHLGTLAKEINLTPQQVETIRASFNSSIGSAPKYDREEAEAHMKAFADAFVAESFDAHAMKGGEVNGHMATWGAHRMVHFYKAAAPVLTPEQRTKVADSLRRHANYKRTDKES
jgi:Spy/CpxP family protein refolding chaperone